VPIGPVCALVTSPESPAIARSPKPGLEVADQDCGLPVEPSLDDAADSALPNIGIR
jgi:hypothetical protein